MKVLQGINPQLLQTETITVNSIKSQPKVSRRFFSSKLSQPTYQYVKDDLVHQKSLNFDQRSMSLKTTCSLPTILSHKKHDTCLIPAMKQNKEREQPRLFESQASYDYNFPQETAPAKQFQIIKTNSSIMLNKKLAKNISKLVRRYGQKDNFKLGERSFSLLQPGETPYNQVEDSQSNLLIKTQINKNYANPSRRRNYDQIHSMKTNPVASLLRPLETSFIEANTLSEYLKSEVKVRASRNQNKDLASLSSLTNVQFSSKEETINVNHLQRKDVQTKQYKKEDSSLKLPTRQIKNGFQYPKGSCSQVKQSSPLFKLKQTSTTKAPTQQLLSALKKVESKADQPNRRNFVKLQMSKSLNSLDGWPSFSNSFVDHSSKSQYSSFDYMNAGLKRKLVLSRDIHKYSRTLIYKPKSFVIDGVTQPDSSWIDSIDWQEMPIYNYYHESQEQKVSLISYLCSKFDQIYTDVELDYYIQLLTQKIPEDQTLKSKSILEAYDYFNQTFNTLKALMNLLGVEPHFNQIMRRYEKKLTLHSILILMNRCRRLYSAIHHLTVIFRLLRKNIASQERDANFKERLRCSITGFFNDHTLLPLRFVFGGVDFIRWLGKKN